MKSLIEKKISDFYSEQTARPMKQRKQLDDSLL